MQPTNTTAAPLSNADYRVWRAEWRTDYAALSADIRTMKMDTRREQSIGDADKASSMQGRLHYRRVEARDMMIERTEIDAARREERARIAREAEATGVEQAA